MLSSFSEVITNDITKFLYQISTILDLPVDILLSRYLPKIKTFKKKKRKVVFKKKNKYHFQNKYRCIARCWGEKHKVMYEVKTRKWIYGTQCKNHRYGLNKYCKTHLKQFKNNGIPHHGNYGSDPPHMHYDKFKKKIESKFFIRKIYHDNV